MSRYRGWVELAGVDGRGRRCQLPDRALARVEEVVAGSRPTGASVRLSDQRGLCHLWVEGDIDRDVPAARAGIVPFFKAIGSVAVGSLGILDIDGAAPVRWVMVRGSLTPAGHPSVADPWTRAATGR